VQKVSGTVDPFLSEKGSEALKPVLDVLFQPVSDAFVYAEQGFFSHMTEKIKDGAFKQNNYTYRGLGDGERLSFVNDQVMVFIISLNYR